MKELIYDVIKQNMNKSVDLNADITFREAGIDSVEFITMIIALEEKFDIRFEDMQLVYDSYKTIGQFVGVVQEIMGK